MLTDHENGDTRREFIKKAAYVVPAVLSVNVALVTARAGSHDIDPRTGGKGETSQRGARDGVERNQRRTDRDK
jgi:hypothetical protein